MNREVRTNLLSYCCVIVIVSSLISYDSFKDVGFRAVFKPIGSAYSAGLNGRVVKKLKAGDGKARTMATAKGITDEHILKNDTILCPVSQVSFPAATIKKKFGGNNEFLLDGVVTNVTESTINSKFVGGTQVSPYPLASFEQFVARRQYKAVTTNFYGTVLVEDRIVNQIESGGWMEGGLLDVAMGMEDCTQPMKVVVSASVYCLKSSVAMPSSSASTPSTSTPSSSSW